MSDVRIPTSFNIELDFEIPEFYRRLLAWVLDFIFLFFYLKIAGLIFEAIFYNLNLYDTDDLHDLWSIRLLLILPIFLYSLICEITLRGQSLGKKITGIKVISENGSKPSLGQFVIRWMFKTSDLMVIVIILKNLSALADSTLIASVGLFILDIILVVSTQKSQRLGDILARTMIIRLQKGSSIEETVFQEISDHYTPSFREIMQLSDKDINSIKNILAMARKRDDFQMAAKTAERIKTHLKISTSMSPFDFLDTLLKDYNYLSYK